MGEGGGRRAGPLLAVEAVTGLSGVGNGIASVALPWLILERTGSAAAAATIAAAASVPMLLVSLLAGTLIDGVGRRRVSVVSDLLSMASVAAIPVVDATVGLDVPTLAGLAVLGSVFDPAGMSAREAMLPEAAGAAGVGLDRANGVHEALWGTAFLVGPGVGGVLIALVGPAATLPATAGLFAAGAAVAAASDVPGAGRPVAHDRPDGLWRGTVEGLRFLAGDPVLRTLAVLVAVIVGLWMPIEASCSPCTSRPSGSPGGWGPCSWR